jgi:hypothetical protein
MKIDWRFVLQTVVLILLFSAAFTKPVQGDAASLPGRYQAVTLPIFDRGKAGQPMTNYEVGGILDTSEGRFWVVMTCDKDNNPKPCIGEISKNPTK